MAKEQIKAVQAQLRLLIPEKDLNKIKKVKNPMKSKTFRTYAELLLNVIKNINIDSVT